MNINRPSDLTDNRRNSFGFIFPNHSCSIGTKGDVETFFLVVNDLIFEGLINDDYLTISRDLYRTLINEDNLSQFKKETVALREEFSKICSDLIAWERYPFNQEYGQFDYQQCRVDPAKSTLGEVFENFFKVFEDAPFWVEKYLTQGMKNFPRIIVSPTEIFTDRKFRKFTDSDFLSSSNDPLWLREPG